MAAVLSSSRTGSFHVRRGVFSHKVTRERDRDPGWLSSRRLICCHSRVLAQTGVHRGRGPHSNLRASIALPLSAHSRGRASASVVSASFRCPLMAGWVASFFWGFSFRFCSCSSSRGGAQAAFFSPGGLWAALSTAHTKPQSSRARASCTFCLILPRAPSLRPFS